VVKTRADAQRAVAKIARGAREDSRGRVMLLDEVLELQQVFPGGREDRRAVGERGTAFERLGVGGKLPGAVARRILKERKRPALVAKRLLGYSLARPARRSVSSAGQSRQKSGLTHGFCAMGRLFLRRNSLMGFMGRSI